MRNVWAQAAVGTVALFGWQIALSFLVPAASAPPPGGLGLVLLSNALTATLLAGLAVRLRAVGWRRALVLWLVWGGIQANAMVEAIFFDINLPRRDALWLTVYLLAVSAGFALCAALAFRGRAEGPAMPALDRAPAWWRFAVTDLLYVFLYFAAGMLAYPYLRAFYEARPMPAMGSVVAMQFVRGLVLSGIVLLILRQLRTTRRTAALLAGLTLSILGGVAPLLVPNAYLPEAIRYAHLPEVGVSNFLFGWIAGLLLSAGTGAQPVGALGRTAPASPPTAAA